MPDEQDSLSGVSVLGLILCFNLNEPQNWVQKSFLCLGYHFKFSMLFDVFNLNEPQN